MKIRLFLIVSACFIYFLAAGQSEKYTAVAKQLEYIHWLDQAGREKMDTVQLLYKNDSVRLKKELSQLWNDIHTQDSVNQIAVTKILDTHGWLGMEDVGADANVTLFLVIQHADLPVQEKYLPMLREAVKNKKAKASELALLEDRVALRQGKKQIYGSQVGWEMLNDFYYVQPLIDPDHVDKRRATVGLPPLAEYLKHWNMKWDVEQYKKDLPAIEKKFWNK